MDQFCQYFTTTWIEDIYHVDDWNQLNDLELRSNNWSESFNALFSKRFAKSHPNIYHLLTVIQDICNYYKYIWQDNMQNKLNFYIDELDKYTKELRATVLKRETKYKHYKYEYLQKLSKIQLTLLLKMEKIFLLENQNNNKRLEEINNMLNSNFEYSYVIDEENDPTIIGNKEKLNIITKHYMRKRIKYLNGKIKESKRKTIKTNGQMKITKRMKTECYLNEKEIEDMEEEQKIHDSNELEKLSNGSFIINDTSQSEVNNEYINDLGEREDDENRDSSENDICFFDVPGRRKSLISREEINIFEEDFSMSTINPPSETDFSLNENRKTSLKRKGEGEEINILSNLNIEKEHGEVNENREEKEEELKDMNAVKKKKIKKKKVKKKVDKQVMEQNIEEPIERKIKKKKRTKKKTFLQKLNQVSKRK